VSVGALPVVLPVNFVLFEGAILVRTIPGTKLDAATAGAVVAFEVDNYAADGAVGWSVVVQGEASEITDPEELARARATPLDSWALDGSADRYIRIDTSIVSGRRFVRQQHP
jgi:nitroimidazol reductase NimA-like FMN-containing flavoprotein (pyridoxamine 5'-phosphate oxidase superfamily)